MARAAATLYISIESKSVNLWENVPWTRVVSWVRAVLAAATLVLSYVYLPGTPVLTDAVLVLFLGYSIVLAARGKGQTGLLGLLALFGDTVYFLVMASYGGVSLLWLASLFYLYVLIEALVYHTAVQLGVVTGVC